jgi:hypothetical protein
MVMVTVARPPSDLRHQLVLQMGVPPHLIVLPTGDHLHLRVLLIMALLHLTGNPHQTFRMEPVTGAVAGVIAVAEAGGAAVA